MSICLNSWVLRPRSFNDGQRPEDGQKKHPLEPFYRVKTERLYIVNVSVGYHGTLRMAKLLFWACVIADTYLI